MLFCSKSIELMDTVDCCFDLSLIDCDCLTVSALEEVCFLPLTEATMISLLT